MSSPKGKKLRRLLVGGLPLIHDIARRMGLREILSQYIPTHGNEIVPAVDTLVLLIYNLTMGKDPLYELEEWVDSLDCRCVGYREFPSVPFNDDRFGRALDKLYTADRASLMTSLVVTVLKRFDIRLDRVHNDSTTLKAFGKIPGRTRTGLELKMGNSKDHRPDLKQLVFSLTLTADGAVPVHQKSYPGNRTDDTTHIETWNTIRNIHGGSDFLYVADCKVCTDEQLSYIVREQGHVITVIPETWTEVASFKESLRKRLKPKHEIWRRRKPGTQDDRQMEYFSAFRGRHVTRKRGYRIHWIYSSEKRNRDRANRQERLQKAETDLMHLNARINTRNLKKRKAIRAAASKILKERQVELFFHLELGTTREEERVQVTPGRPGKNTQYRRLVKRIYTLSWARNLKALEAESRTDGVFPLLCTDEKLSSKEVLQAYKYQPRLEKRFGQFKGIHNGAPLLFKKIERVEANMFAFFIALMIQALMEREVRNKMPEEQLDSLPVYPEDREATHPTTAKLLKIFEAVSTYKLMRGQTLMEEFTDDLTKTQKLILKLLAIPVQRFWQSL